MSSHEVFKRDGMPISIEKTEASVYRAWASASEWLDPQLYHADGTKVKETTAFKYLGQYKERQGARKEVDVRIGDANSAWHLLKAKLFRCKNLGVAGRGLLPAGGVFVFF